MDYIDTLKLFIRAERVGNWNMHIIAVGRMLNLFAATGHFNYAKSASTPIDVRATRWPPLAE